MHKTATLLITHIHKLYTGKEINHHRIVLQDAYVGVFHDTIIAVGTNDYSHLIDKDTRVIDATGHIMVPGLIEINMEVKTMQRFDEARILHEYAFSYMKHGVTTMQISKPAPVWHYPFYAYDIVWNIPVSDQYPMITIDSILNQRIKYRRFCISASYESCDPLHTAQLLYLKEQIDPYILLKALTWYPAKSLGLRRLGMIDSGMIADMLLINAHDLTSMFATLSEGLIFQVIKKGVRIYPNVIV